MSCTRRFKIELTELRDWITANRLADRLNIIREIQRRIDLKDELLSIEEASRLEQTATQTGTPDENISGFSLGGNRWEPPT